MSSAQAPEVVPHEPSISAAVLSYLIPGLGQIVQGRYGKGVLFMVSLLGMFFLGQAMGNWQNVHVARDGGGVQGRGLSGLVLRWHYWGQVWIGVAAWPALLQHFDSWPIQNAENHPFWHKFQKMPNEDDVNDFLRNSDKTPDLGWVYTVIAGMLNLLVIYDAYAGAAFSGVRPTIKPTTAPAAEPKREGAV